MNVNEFGHCKDLKQFYNEIREFYRSHYKDDFLRYYDTLQKLAGECSSYRELGVMQGGSAAAVLSGNANIKAELIDRSFQHLNNHKHVFNGYNVSFVESDSLVCPVNECEMTLIDSMHHYKHVNKEIRRYENSVSKYLVFHDSNYHEIKRAIDECVARGKFKINILDDKSYGYCVLERR
tara:strand:- start:6610 stop:7146 length:537 start_codon:yes stop_codon:yes gene_type:complete